MPTVMKLTCIALLAAAALSQTLPVLPGLDVFIGDVPPALRGKRVGLITNHSAIDRREPRRSI